MKCNNYLFGVFLFLHLKLLRRLYQMTMLLLFFLRNIVFIFGFILNEGGLLQKTKQVEEIKI